MLPAPIVKAQMLIRRPVAEVFEAFIDPAVTSQFWFTSGSGRLESGTEVRWAWEMFGVSAQVSVKAVEQNQRILIEWADRHGAPCPVEWRFTPRTDETTFVTITTQGFTGSDDEVVSQALDQMGGFAYVLAGAKAWLEHSVRLNLVADHV